MIPMTRAFSICFLSSTACALPATFDTFLDSVASSTRSFKRARPPSGGERRF